MAEPRTPRFEQVVRDSFASQQLMATIGARGRVVRAGRTITVCQAEASMLADGVETLVATMLATIMTVRDRPEIVG
jgi:acyl-coenzyme A thioesterase PaaI-like protein